VLDITLVQFASFIMTLSWQGVSGKSQDFLGPTSLGLNAGKRSERKEAAPLAMPGCSYYDPADILSEETLIPLTFVKGAKWVASFIPPYLSASNKQSCCWLRKLEALERPPWTRWASFGCHYDPPENVLACCNNLVQH